MINMGAFEVRDLIRAETHETVADPVMVDGMRANGGNTGEYTLCVLADEERLLMKFAERGPSKGKWNFPGGKIEDGESIVQCAIREVIGETGLTMHDTFYHGFVDAYHGNDGVCNRVHILSSESFTGKLRSSIKGEVTWIPKVRVPVRKMWHDVQIWLPHIEHRREFRVVARYNNERGDVLEGLEIKVKDRERVRRPEKEKQY
jgi:8-oxo-dGTP pyrophosphatase MutT (NUDIX family)